MSSKTVWCSACDRSYIFFVDAPAREHALTWHQDKVQWSQKHGYYIGSPHFEGTAETGLPPITTNEIIDNAELSRKEWDEALHAVTDRYIVN